MFNSLLDKTVNAIASFKMRKYQTYPSISTAIVLVNVQNAFMSDQTALSESLVQLLSLAKRHQFSVIYAPFGW